APDRHPRSPLERPGEPTPELELGHRLDRAKARPLGIPAHVLERVDLVLGAAFRREGEIEPPLVVDAGLLPDHREPGPTGLVCESSHRDGLVKRGSPYYRVLSAGRPHATERSARGCTGRSHASRNRSSTGRSPPSARSRVGVSPT